MQQDNNIKNKLRELDAAQQPDLSSMDAHWQQMAALLQPVAAPAKKGWPKWILNGLTAAAVIALVTTAWVLVRSNQPHGDEALVKRYETPANQTDTAAVVVNTDTALTPPLIKTEVGLSAANNNLHTAKMYVDQDLIPVDNNPVFDSLKINYTPCDACPVKKTIPGVVPVSRRELLQQLFQQLEKEVQVFWVDNRRDTLLAAKQGSALFIPAKSLGGDSAIQLTAREFYSNSDIVMNRLSTYSDGAMLITGGMLQLQATYNGKELSPGGENSIKLFMPDTGSSMQQMRLFNGLSQAVDTGTATPEAGLTAGNATRVNWLPQPQYFSRKNMVTELRVLNLVDQPYRTKDTRRGQVAYFIIDEEHLKITKAELKEQLKNKFGYYKVKLRSGIRNYFKYSNDNRPFDREYATNMGDSVWMKKDLADKYRLDATATRQAEETIVTPGYSTAIPMQQRININSAGIDTMGDGSPAQDAAASVLQTLQNKYSVNLTQLGWINCDRFYSDSRKKTSFEVDLGDSALNYYTTIIFDNFKSMMTGLISGNKVIFPNIPMGEPVKVISIGINKKGETIYSVTSTTTSNRELSGLQFEATSVPDLKASLSKIDQ